MATTVEYDKSEGRALRLLELYFYIEENPGATADQLARAFNISVATLYRDIQSLRKMGIAVSYETPNRGGYHIDKGSIRFARIKPDEVKPLLIARNLLDKIAFPGGQIFDRLVEQIVGTIREEDMERIRENLNKYLYLRAPMNRRFSLEAKIHVQFLSDLLQAIENQWSVQIEYPRSKELSNRTVNPLGLWFGHNAWYLAAWSHERKACRTFAIDRISKLEVLPHKPFKRPVDFDLVQWVETSWIELAFEHDTGLDIAQAFWHQSQEFTIPKNPKKPVIGKFKLCKRSMETEFLSWIRSFGSKVEIIAPKSLSK